MLLHDHLDGGVRAETLRRLSDGAFKEYRDPNHGSLVTYLKSFESVLQFMQTSRNLTEVTYESVCDLQADGVSAFELRFAPELHTQRGLTVGQVVAYAAEGLRSGLSEFKELRGGLILCALRGRSPARLIEGLEEACDTGLVVGVDLAGDESIGKISDYTEFFKKAKALGLGVTVHAGETGSWENVLEAIGNGADRIGHGIAVAHAPEEVRNYIKKTGVCLEVCISSNVHTGAVADLDSHPVLSMLREGFKVTINTDNRAISNTTQRGEYAVARTLGVSDSEIEEMEKNAESSSFLR